MDNTYQCVPFYEAIAAKNGEANVLIEMNRKHIAKTRRLHRSKRRT